MPLYSCIDYVGSGRRYRHRHSLHQRVKLVKWCREDPATSAVDNDRRDSGEGIVIDAGDRLPCIIKYFAHCLLNALIKLRMTCSPERIEIQHQHHFALWRTGRVPQPA